MDWAEKELNTPSSFDLPEFLKWFAESFSSAIERVQCDPVVFTDYEDDAGPNDLLNMIDTLKFVKFKTYIKVPKP